MPLRNRQPVAHADGTLTLLLACGREYDAILAGARLLASKLADGSIRPNDGDVGDILTCAGLHPGMTADEVHAMADLWQGDAEEEAGAPPALSPAPSRTPATPYVVTGPDDAVGVGGIIPTLGAFATEDEAVAFLDTSPLIDKVKLHAGCYGIDGPPDDDDGEVEPEAIRVAIRPDDDDGEGFIVENRQGSDIPTEPRYFGTVEEAQGAAADRLLRFQEKGQRASIVREQS